MSWNALFLGIAKDNFVFNSAVDFIVGAINESVFPTKGLRRKHCTASNNSRFVQKQISFGLITSQSHFWLDNHKLSYWCFSSRMFENWKEWDYFLVVLPAPCASLFINVKIPHDGICMLEERHGKCWQRPKVLWQQEAVKWEGKIGRKEGIRWKRRREQDIFVETKICPTFPLHLLLLSTPLLLLLLQSL